MEFNGIRSFLGFAKLFSCIATTAISHLLTYPFRSTRSVSLGKDVLHAGIRALLTHVTIPQARYLNPFTTQRYRSFCDSESQISISLSVAYGPGTNREACAHWVGDPAAQIVILYFHGGAFFQPATPGMFLYLRSLTQKLEKETSKSVAALVLAYSLAPEAAFPTQLQEGAAILSELLYPSSSSSKKRSPGDIILAGDSAGGNLTLALISHLLHPHSQVDEIRLEERIGGVLLYSPCVSYSLDWESMRRNASRDMLPPSKVPVWGGMYVGQIDSLQTPMNGLRLRMDAYSEPYIAGASWWRGLSKVVGSLLVLSGGEEVLADSIRDFGERLKEEWREGGGDVKGIAFVEMPQEAHIGPIIDFMMSRGKETSTSQRLVEEWLAARLGCSG